MGSFDTLLELQDLDMEIDRLDHKIATLAQRAELDGHRARMVAFDEATDAVRGARDRLARDQKRVEDDVALVVAKAVEVDGSLYGGTVTSPRELQALQAELESVKARQSQLEDMVLELMEQIEPLDEDLSDRAAEQASLQAREQELVAELSSAEAELAVQLAELAERRSALVAGVDPELVASYDRLRAHHDGVGVARLVGSTCSGCHLALSAVELDRVKRQPPDAMVYCEECGRLLVRP